MAEAPMVDDSPLVTHPPLRPARFVARSKRFIVHAEMDVDGTSTPVQAHLADPGRLVGVLEPGAQIWLSGPYPAPRKLAWTVHLVEVPGDTGPVFVTVNSTLANQAVFEAHRRGLLVGLPDAPPKREVSVFFGDGGRAFFGAKKDHPDKRRHRLDLGWPQLNPVVLCEVKTVSHAEDRCGLWPDAPSERGRGHVASLAAFARAGGNAVLMFVTGREDIDEVRPHVAIDPAFATTLADAELAGVRVLAMRLRFDVEGAWFAGLLACRGASRPLSAN